MNNYHTSVFLNEALQYLQIKKDEWYVDCNLGGGGHTAKILELGGKVLGIDLDADAVQVVSKNYELRIMNNGDELVGLSDNLIVVQSNFVEIDYLVNEYIGEKVSGVLFDLGVSSHQLDEGERGFSFQKEASLDMRMNQSFGATAADLVNGLHQKELMELFQTLGEEEMAFHIAKRIVETRSSKPIKTTTDLANLVASVKRKTSPGIHPATKVFQALRIAVNDELHALEEALPKAFEVLKSGGRIVVITFHSLEDRIVKNAFKKLEAEGLGKLITKKPIAPTDQEIENNPRARSAKLRMIEKI